MASRRLVDLAAIASAASSIAQRHFLIRSHQLAVYTSTSTLSHVFRQAGAIVPSSLSRSSGVSASEDSLKPNSPNGGVKHEWSNTGASSGTGSSYSPSAASTASTILNPHKSSPPPPPEEAKRLQHDSESSIPSVVADAPSSALENHKDVRGEKEINAEKLTEGLNEDSFYLRHSRISNIFSNLPRMKIPRNTEGEQSTVGEPGINSDTFYETPGKKSFEQRIPGKTVVPEQQEDGVMEGLNSEIFHSRKARDLVGKRGEFKVKKAVGTPKDNTEFTEGRDQDTFYVKETGQDKPSSPAEDAMKAVSEEPLQEQKQFQMTASRVPSSRISRLFHYGGLAAGMAWGAAGEGLKRATGGGSSSDNTGSLMLSPANIERLVKKMSRMRGAALKLGQVMSFQDSKVLPPVIHQILLRVQDSADYMPSSQRDSVLISNLGPDWRSLFSEFSEVPMAAASIGQVHAATLASNGLPVAVKIQYPGVADSITSDLNNIAVLLTATRLLPKGLYLDKTIANARIELGWECDYIREATCIRRFAELLKDESETYSVPLVLEEASGPQVLTMQRMWGVGVTKAIKDLNQEERDWVGEKIMRLCFREVAVFKFMQTDPNWTNFLWNKDQKKIELLDFGASREYDPEFINLYCSVLKAAARGDIPAIQEISIKLGYLTGLESPSMLKAHITSITTLAEPFSQTAPEIYDFSNQTVTERVRGQIPLMIRERLTPPPEETYSLHRKLSGAFLLCARLGSKVRCRRVFEEALGR